MEATLIFRPSTHLRGWKPRAEMLTWVLCLQSLVNISQHDYDVGMGGAQWRVGIIIGA